MSETLLAFLEIKGELRQCCVGCSSALHSAGMLEIVSEKPLDKLLISPPR